TLLPFPVDMKPYMVAELRATRDELRGNLGEPHFVETESTRTCGGEEDNWAWELASGQRLLLVWSGAFGGGAVLMCDPPDPNPAIIALGIDAEKQQLEVFPTPIVHPSYTGP